MAKEPPERTELTGDQIFALVEPKLSEYYKIFRLAAWAVGGLFSLFVMVVGAIFAIPNVKSNVVRYVVQFDGQLKNYFDSPDGRKMLASKMEEFLKNPQGTALVKSELEDYLKLNAVTAFDNRFKTRLTEELDRTVAYSYSSSFQLSDAKNQFEMSIYKLDGDEGLVGCTATYPKGIGNAVLIYLNNQQDNISALVPANSNIAKSQFHLEKSNKMLYSTLTNKDAILPDQKVRFQMVDTPPVPSPIWINCLVRIVGPARLAQSGTGQ